MRARTSDSSEPETHAVQSHSHPNREEHKRVCGERESVCYRDNRYAKTPEGADVHSDVRRGQSPHVLNRSATYTHKHTLYYENNAHVKSWEPQ